MCSWSARRCWVRHWDPAAVCAAGDCCSPPPCAARQGWSALQAARLGTTVAGLHAYPRVWCGRELHWTGWTCTAHAHCLCSAGSDEGTSTGITGSLRSAGVWGMPTCAASGPGWAAWLPGAWPAPWVKAQGGCPASCACLRVRSPGALRTQTGDARCILPVAGCSRNPPALWRAGAAWACRLPWGSAQQPARPGWGLASRAGLCGLKCSSTPHRRAQTPLGRGSLAWEPGL